VTLARTWRSKRWNRDDDPYASWAAGYPARAHNVLMTVEEAAMMSLVPTLEGLTVLDAGCGTGRYSRLLAGRGAREVVGIDRSPAMLAHACPELRGIRGRLSALPFTDGSFDLIVSGLVLPDIADLEPVVAEWSRVLKTGGAVLASTLHPRGGALGWTRTFDTPQGRRTLAACWHSLDDLRAICTAHGLSIDAVLEPPLPSRMSEDDPTESLSQSPSSAAALIIRARRR